MATESKAPIRLRNGGSECGSGGQQREVEAYTMRCQPECTIKIATQQPGRGNPSEKFGLCVGQRNLLPCQLLGLPRYDATRDEDDRCHCRKGPTCDPLRACDACLRVRGASLGCLYLSNLRLIALEGLFLPRAPMTAR